jgi:hypothetical protein
LTANGVAALSFDTLGAGETEAVFYAQNVTFLGARLISIAA